MSLVAPRYEQHVESPERLAAGRAPVVHVHVQQRAAGCEAHKGVAIIDPELNRGYTLEDLPDARRDPWPAGVTEVHRLWWEARIARQQEIDASIGARAEVDYLYDKPYEDRKKVRVAGPFTVENLSPHRLLAVNERDELIDRVADRALAYGAAEDLAAMVLGHLATTGVQQAHKADRITFSSVDPWPGDRVCGQGRYTEGEEGPERGAGILVEPNFGTVARQEKALCRYRHNAFLASERGARLHCHVLAGTFVQLARRASALRRPGIRAPGRRLGAAAPLSDGLHPPQASTRCRILTGLRLSSLHECRLSRLRRPAASLRSEYGFRFA